MWRELEKKSICASATDKGTQASEQLWVASVQLMSHQGWRPS